jgi:hypothetical protein
VASLVLAAAGGNFLREHWIFYRACRRQKQLFFFFFGGGQNGHIYTGMHIFYIVAGEKNFVFFGGQNRAIYTHFLHSPAQTKTILGCFWCQNGAIYIPVYIHIFYTAHCRRKNSDFLGSKWCHIYTFWIFLGSKFCFSKNKKINKF